MDGNAVAPDLLPQRLGDWFASRGWQPHAHQLAMLQAARNGQSTLLVAPTGGGKTLAGFLPTLAEFAGLPRRSVVPRPPRKGFHTLYISPLKALTVDIARNLQAPIAEMKLDIECEVRTGDTSAARRQRQRLMPPDILLTTPESLALMLSYIEAPTLFGTVKTVVIDELHALADSKRGQLLALGLARIAKLAPDVRFVGLSATVPDPPGLADWLRFDRAAPVQLVYGRPGAQPQMAIMIPEARLPWGGHMAVYAMPEVYNAIRQHKTTLVFVNTRAQAELAFQALWKLNDENLAIGLHHGSLAVEQRRKVEAAMARGGLRAVVATSSLDLGIDWGDIDLVVQVGAPKGASRLLQRIGRANHRLDEPSRALLVPANRFEVLECQAAIDASMAGDLDGYPARPPCLDVLAQHIIGMACSRPVEPDALFEEITSAAPFRDLPRQDFDDTFRFCVDGGYALRAYDRYHRLVGTYDGESTSLYRIANPRVAQQYRMNIGTIVEAAMLKVKLKRGPVLGEIEEWFVQGLVEGDTFVFAGRHLRFEGVRAMAVECTPALKGDPSVPAYAGGRLPLTTGLADRVRAMLANVEQQSRLPADVQEWLRLQRWRSVLPDTTGVLVESFPRGGKHFLVSYCFEGRNAHQTLGMLLTRRMERLRLRPLGFVATDYVLAVWSLLQPTERQVEELFKQDMLGDDLEEWMDESSMLKRSFRNVAVVAGLIERRHPGEEKNKRQVTFSADLIYDTLRRHEPNHILLRATRQDAAWNLADVGRLNDFLARIQGRIHLRRTDRVTPLAVPVLLDIGREQVYGEGVDALLGEMTEELVAEATAGAEAALAKEEAG